MNKLISASVDQFFSLSSPRCHHQRTHSVTPPSYIELQPPNFNVFSATPAVVSPLSAYRLSGDNVCDDAMLSPIRLSVESSECSFLGVSFSPPEAEFASPPEPTGRISSLASRGRRDNLRLPFRVLSDVALKTKGKNEEFNDTPHDEYYESRMSLPELFSSAKVTV